MDAVFSNKRDALDAARVMSRAQGWEDGAVAVEFAGADAGTFGVLRASSPTYRFYRLHNKYLDFLAAYVDGVCTP